MKKILFLDEHKVVNYAGGVEKVICNFSNEFVNRGFEIAFVCMDKEQGRPFYPLDSRVKFVNLWYSYGDSVFGGNVWLWKKIQKELLRTVAGSRMVFMGRILEDPKKKYFYDSFVVRLKNFMKEWQPDMIIAISVDGAALAHGAIENEYDLPVIAMCHTDPARFVPDFTAEQREAWKKCCCVQVLMESFRPVVEALGVKKVVRIPNAVAQTADDDIRDVTKCHHRLITVGRIDGSAKRQHLFIEGFARIAARYPEWTAHIYGDVANKRYKKRLDRIIASNGLQKRIFFEGVTKDMLRVLRESDIFVFPSEYEGMPLALAEAMSAGVPAIGCKDCTAVAELLSGGCGHLAEPTAEGLADGMAKLIEELSLRQSFSQAAHERAQSFAEEKIWGQWGQLLDEYV